MATGNAVHGKLVSARYESVVDQNATVSPFDSQPDLFHLSLNTFHSSYETSQHIFSSSFTSLHFPPFTPHNLMCDLVRGENI